MKKCITLFFAVLAAIFVTGCGPSLRDYVAAANSYQSRVSSTTSVQVDIQANDVVRPTNNRAANIIGGALNVAASVGAAAMTVEQTERLQRLVHSEEMASLVSNGFDDGFADATHLTVVDNSADLRILLTLHKYGVWAESLLSPMYFYVEADIRMVDVASMQVIYESGASVMREATDMFSEIVQQLTSGVQEEIHDSVPRIRKTRVALDTVDNVSRLVSGAASLSSFLRLTDSDIQLIFRYLSFDAGVVIAEQLIKAIYR